MWLYVELKYIYYRKREKLRAGYYFFFLIRTMLLLTATWFHRYTTISPSCLKMLPVESSTKIWPTFCLMKSVINSNIGNLVERLMPK